LPMLQQKRIRKPPQHLVVPNLPLMTKKKGAKSKKNIKRCAYQPIPFPTKFICSSKTYCLYNDIVIMEQGDNIVFEPSLLNRFLRFEQIQVSGVSEKKLLHIKVEKRKGLKILSWRQAFKNLCEKGKSLSEWSQLIKQFSEKCEAKGKDGVLFKEEEISPINNLTGDQNIRKERLFEENPCFLIKFGNKNGREGISEIVYNQALIHELGYTFDTFASTILQDGIPQLIPFEDEANYAILRALLQQNFQSEQSYYQTKEFFSHIFTKDNSVKEAVLQVYFLKDLSSQSKVVEILLVFKNIGNSYPNYGNFAKSRLNRNFLEKSSAYQYQTNYFLSSYYPELMPFKYVNPAKVCGIKELPLDEDDDDDDNIEAKIETKSEDI